MKQKRKIILMLFALSFGIVMSQNNKVNITGSVVDKQGIAIPGATVLVVGTSTGAVTDFDGQFSIAVPNKSSVLLFSYLGYISKEITVGNQTIINVALEEDVVGLDEVVVVGYGTTKKSDLTGSVVSVKSDKVLETKSSNFMEGLQGRLAGVQIVSGSGAPGASVDIQIRGAVSINAGSKPLYVIDGVQFDPNESVVAQSSIGDESQSPLAFLNPADIESLEVLKDASATAIFGARGANGVVMITTKGGESSKNSFSFSSYVSIATFPESRRIDVLEAGDYADWFRSFENPGDNSFFWESTDPDAAPVDFSNAETINWQKELTRTAITKNSSLNFTSSSKGNSFSGSISYSDQEGVILNSDYNRITARLRGHSQVNEKTKIGGLLNFSNSVSNGIPEGGAQGPNAGAIQSIVLFNPLNPETYENASIDDFDDANVDLSRPFDFVVNSERRNTLNNLIGNFYVDYEIAKGLKLKSSFGGKVSSSKLKEFYPASVLQGGVGLASGEIAEVQNVNWNQENVLTYNKRFNKNHRINATMVFESRSNTIERVNAVNSDFDFEGLGADDLGAGSSPSPPSSARVTFNNLASLARINYYLMDGKYIFTGSIRADGSSKFQRDRQWGYFPSGAFAWKVSEEKFLQNSSTISNLKFRTSFGVTGNDRLEAFQFSSFYAPFQAISDDQIVISYKPEVLGNNALTWETSTQYNIGIDLGLFNNRVSLTAEYYNRITDDMLFKSVVPAITGFADQWNNIGRIDNEGYEFLIDAVAVSSKDFSWRLNANANFQKSTIKSLGNIDFIDVDFRGGNDLIGRMVVGGEFGAYYGYEFGGIAQYNHFEEFQGMTIAEAATIFDPSQTYTVVTDTNGNPVIPTHIGQTSLTPGDMYFVDQDGDNLVDEINDKKAIGSSNPKVYGGFSSQFRYKNFDLNTNFTFSVGNELYNEGRVALEGLRGKSKNISQEYFDSAWEPLRPSNTHVSFKGFGSDLTSSYFVEDGSYLKLQSMSFGYTFAKDVLENLKLKRLRIYFNANNVFVWTKYRGFDPDIRGPRLLPGYDRLNYPKPLIITTGLDINF